MNNPLDTKSGAPMLKQFYPVKKPKGPPGPVAEMNANLPQIQAIRQKRDMIAKTNLMQNPMANKIMAPPGKPMVPQGGLKHPPVKRRGF